MNAKQITVPASKRDYRPVCKYYLLHRRSRHQHPDCKHGENCINYHGDKGGLCPQHARHTASPDTVAPCKFGARCCNRHIDVPQGKPLCKYHLDGKCFFDNCWNRHLKVFLIVSLLNNSNGLLEINNCDLLIHDNNTIFIPNGMELGDVLGLKLE
jgi:hypothetical protein